MPADDARPTRREPHRVVALLEGAAASASQQILIGDELVSIDGKPCKGKQIRDVRRMITGHAGTEVVMVFKQMDGEVKELTLVRGGAGAPVYHAK